MVTYICGYQVVKTKENGKMNKKDLEVLNRLMQDKSIKGKRI